MGGVDAIRVSVTEWPEELWPSGDAWQAIAAAVIAAHPDTLITNELPFGHWLSSAPTFDRQQAEDSVREHATGMQALVALGLPAIVSSRSVWEGDQLPNEAVLIEGGAVSGFHRKQYLPAETGWHEDRWFVTETRDFRTMRIGDISVGVLLCTEAMFPEHARAYGRADAALIAIPRATGEATAQWHLAARMAALVSGCYVVSANRTGTAAEGGPAFGGEGFAYAPDGTLLGVTSRSAPILTVEVDPRVVADGRRLYPRYVTERSGAERSQAETAWRRRSNRRL